VPPDLLTRAMLAKRAMMAFATKKLRQLLGRAGG
jgi:hypothetical protein